MCLEAARMEILLRHVLPPTLSAKRADSRMLRTRAAGYQANLTASECMPMLTVCIRTLYNKKSSNNLLSTIYAGLSCICLSEQQWQSWLRCFVFFNSL